MSVQASAFRLGLAGQINPEKVRCTNTIPLKAAGAGTQQINLTANQNNDANFIDSALSMYVNNQGQAASLTFQFSSGQLIEVAPNKQGYYNILQPNPINFTVSPSGATTATVQLINTFIPPQIWDAA